MPESTGARTYSEEVWNLALETFGNRILRKCIIRVSASGALFGRMNEVKATFHSKRMRCSTDHEAYQGEEDVTHIGVWGSEMSAVLYWVPGLTADELETYQTLRRDGASPDAARQLTSLVMNP